MEVARSTGPAVDLGSLVARVAAGDRRAESELVAHFERGVALIARRHARPHEHRVPDVVQTVLMNAIERLRSGALREAAALPGYLRTSVVNEIASLYRARATADEEAAHDDAALARAASAETPERRAMNEQLVGRVLDAIRQLPMPRDRELLIRFYVREQSRDEVCAALGIDEAHFRRVLFRARERLQAAIGEPA